MVLVSGDGDDVEEDGDVEHGNRLQGNTNDERALATERVDQEQSADDGGDELDHTKDSSGKEGSLLADDTDDLEQVRSVDGDGRAARPAGHELGEVGEEQTVRVALDAEDLAAHALPAHAGGGFLLFLEGVLDAGELLDDVGVGGGHAAELGEVLERLVTLSGADEETGRLDGEEGGEEDDDAEHEVDRRRQQPASGSAGDGIVDLSAVVGEVGDQNTKVDGSGESTRAETTNGSRRNFTQVDGTDDDSLANADAGKETTEVYKLHVSTVSHKDRNTDEPNDAELASGPDTTVPIASEESEKSTGDRAKLDHGRNVALDVGEGACVKSVEAKAFFENVSVEDTGDETFVDTASGAHEAESEDCEP